MFEAVYDTWTMLKDAVSWWVLMEAITFILVFSSVIFVGLYVFVIELPGMFMNWIIGQAELLLVKLEAKRKGLPQPTNDADVYQLSKNGGFVKTIREIRILINQWFLLLQNGSAGIMFGFIWFAILIYFFYAISQGQSMSNGATLLEYANEMLEVMPYAIILLGITSFIWAGYTIVASSWKIYQFMMFKERIWEKDPFKELKEITRKQPKE